MSYRPANSIRDPSVIENAQVLLKELKAMGVSVSRERVAGKMRLQVSGAAGVLTGVTLTRIRRNAAQLRDHLRSQEAKARADRIWAQQRGLEVPAEAPVRRPDPEITITI